MCITAVTMLPVLLLGMLHQGSHSTRRWVVLHQCAKSGDSSHSQGTHKRPHPLGSLQGTNSLAGLRSMAASSKGRPAAINTRGSRWQLAAGAGQAAECSALQAYLPSICADHVARPSRAALPLAHRTNHKHYTR